MLYVLTYADIESVGKGTYSNLNASLIRQLYEISIEAFNHDKMIDEATKRAKAEKRLKKDIEFSRLKKTTQKLRNKTINKIKTNKKQKKQEQIKRWKHNGINTK